MKKGLRCVLALGILAAPGFGALITNGGLETGDLTGWSTLSDGTTPGLDGNVAVVNAFLGPRSNTLLTPYEGSFFALLTGGGTSGFAVIESFLGLTAGSITGLDSDATNGSAMKQDIAMLSGETIFFRAWFQAEETDPGFNDFGFYSVVGPGTNAATLISSISLLGSATGGTGWLTFSFTAPSDGTYTLGFGVLNGGDNGIPSLLGVDGVAVPEPGTAWLAGLGGALLIFGRSRRARA